VLINLGKAKILIIGYAMLVKMLFELYKFINMRFLELPFLGVGYIQKILQ
jgi:hypothetical protein